MSCLKPGTRAKVPGDFGGGEVFGDTGITWVGPGIGPWRVGGPWDSGRVSFCGSRDRSLVPGSRDWSLGRWVGLG